jgi:MHS family proline/betaine transporter-like MFS transporter
VLAPILLVVFRLLQGLSAGGEWGGSTSYIVEYAPEGRRGFIGSWQQVSVGSGFLLGSVSAALLSSTLSLEAFISWGWRVPFLLGILVGILGAYLRWRLNDTPKFTEIKQHGEVAKAPLIEALTKYRREALTIFGLTRHNTVAYYIPIIYMTGLFRNPPDPRALHRLVNRLQRRGGGVWRLRSIHRDLVDRCYRQQLGSVLLSHRGSDDHVR